MSSISGSSHSSLDFSSVHTNRLSSVIHGNTDELTLSQVKNELEAVKLQLKNQQIINQQLSSRQNHTNITTPVDSNVDNLASEKNSLINELNDQRLLCEELSLQLSSSQLNEKKFQNDLMQLNMRYGALELQYNEKELLLISKEGEISRLANLHNDSQAELANLLNSNTKLNENLNNLTDELHSLANLNSLNTKKSVEMEQAHSKISQIKEETAAEKSLLFSQLHSSKSLIQQLKSDYSVYIEQSNRNHKQHIDKLNHTISSLANANKQLIHDKHNKLTQLYTESNNLYLFLQQQFESYQSMVEKNFYFELQNFQIEVKNIRENFDKEILLIFNSKQQEINSIIINKDAKIFNLINGHDLQSLLIDHKVELENLAKIHQRNLHNERINQQNHYNQELNQLNHTIQTQQLSLEQQKNQISSLQAQLHASLQQVKKVQGKFEKQLNELRMENNELNNNLAANHSAIQSLTQAKENLRHQIFSLKLKYSNANNFTVENQLRKLNSQQALLEEKCSEIEKHSNGTTNLLHHVNVIQELKQELKQSRSAYQQLLNSFESFLKHKINQQLPSNNSPFNSFTDQFLQHIVKIAHKRKLIHSQPNLEHTATATSALAMINHANKSKASSKYSDTENGKAVSIITSAVAAGVAKNLYHPPATVDVNQLNHIAEAYKYINTLKATLKRSPTAKLALPSTQHLPLLQNNC
jgi:chromosome segregation ATPase